MLGGADKLVDLFILSRLSFLAPLPPFGSEGTVTEANFHRTTVDS